MIFSESISSRACLSAKEYRKSVFYKMDAQFYICGCKIGRLGIIEDESSLFVK